MYTLDNTIAKVKRYNALDNFYDHDGNELESCSDATVQKALKLLEGCRIYMRESQVDCIPLGNGTIYISWIMPGTFDYYDKKLAIRVHDGRMYTGYYRFPYNDKMETVTIETDNELVIYSWIGTLET